MSLQLPERDTVQRGAAVDSVKLVSGTRTRSLELILSTTACTIRLVFLYLLSASFERYKMSPVSPEVGSDDREDSIDGAARAVPSWAVPSELSRHEVCLHQGNEGIATDTGVVGFRGRGGHRSCRGGDEVNPSTGREVVERSSFVGSSARDRFCYLVAVHPHVPGWNAREQLQPLVGRRPRSLLEVDPHADRCEIE